jgi:hypothetical protein
MIGTILLSSLMVVFRNEYIFNITVLYFVFLLNYYLISSISGKLKLGLDFKKILGLSLGFGLVTSILIPNIYVYTFFVGAVLWILIESYSFSALSWDLSEKLPKIKDRFRTSLVIVVVYLGYLGIKLVISVASSGSQANKQVSIIDMLFALFMFFYAFSKMGSRFMHAKRVGSALITVFIMVITLAYVLFVYSPYDKEQTLYYAGKFLGISITLPAFHFLRKLKRDPLGEEIKTLDTKINQ